MNAVALPAQSNVAALTMSAIVQRKYGTPDVLALEEVARPIPGDDDVLVRVHAAGATIGDHHVVTGKPYLIRLTPFGGLPGPRNKVPGQTMAGTVEAVGAKVTTLRPGDEVFGQANTGAFAEYVVMPAKLLAPRPASLSFEEAAATAWAVSVLQGFRAAGGLKAGQRILINGAAGALGTWAVQIAKALGAHVTAVCSTRKVAMVRKLGADEVLDYSTQDFVTGGARFDMLFDFVGNRSLSECRSVLTPGGTYLPCSGGGGDWAGPIFRAIGGLVSFMFTRQKFAMFVGTANRDDLVALTALVDSGKARPVIERTYPLSQAGEALRHVGEGHAQGQTVIKIAA